MSSGYGNIFQRKVFSFASILCLVLVGILWLQYSGEKERLTREARDHAAMLARGAVQEIATSLNKLVPVNISISEDLTSGRLKSENIVARIKADKTANPIIFGLGVAYAPYSFSPDVRLYAPLYVNREGGAELVQIEDQYDYTEEGRDWYHLPLAKGPMWQEPHYGQASKAFLANFTSPFYAIDPETGETKPAGVVFSSMSLPQYRQIAESLDLGKGYAFILSTAGTFVSHPDQKFVDDNRSLTQWASAFNDPQMTRLAEQTLMGRHSFAEHREDGELFWYFTEPIITTGWSAGVVLPKHNLVTKPNAFYTYAMALSGLLFLVFRIRIFMLKKKSLAPITES